MSDRVKFDTMRNALNMDKKTFDSKIFDWATEFGFRIDGDYIKIKQENIDNFINMLDKQFESWERQETSGTGKINESRAKSLYLSNQQRLEPIEPISLEKEISPNRKKYDYFVDLGKNYIKSKQYQEALNKYQQARKVCEELCDVNLTIEIDKLIKQIENSLKEEQEKLREKAKKEAEKRKKLEAEIQLRKIISFSGAQIPQFEADLLQEIEKQSNKQFENFNEINWNTKMGFMTKNQRAVGIGLYKCGLSTLPELIGKLSSLKELHLYNNQLMTLPESIGNLSSLKKLHLYNNQLTTLPESIGNLSSLQTLDLRWNKLSTLPESIGNLSSLQTLNLRWNKLTTLPESMTNLTSLKNLYISYNPLDSRAKSVLKQLKKKGVKVSK